MVKKNQFKDRNYGQILAEFIETAASKGLSENEAREIHRRWKSLGLRAQKGRL